MARRAARRPGDDAVRGDDLRELVDGQDPDDVGRQAVSVVQARVRATGRLVPVIYAFTGAIEDLAEGIAESTAYTDDLFWAYHVARPFTWQRYIDWWAARRWLLPRDVTRR